MGWLGFRLLFPIDIPVVWTEELLFKRKRRGIPVLHAVSVRKYAQLGAAKNGAEYQSLHKLEWYDGSMT